MAVEGERLRMTILEVTDGRVVRSGVSSGGHEFEPQCG